MNDIAQVATIADKIREKIKSQVVDLIPDEQWEAMVKREVELMLVSSKDTYGRFQPAAIGELIRTELRAVFNKKLQEAFADEKFLAKHDVNGKTLASDAVKECILKMSGEILQAMVANAVQDALDQMRFQNQ